MKLEKRSSFGWPATAAGYAPCLNGIVCHYDGSRQNLAAKDHSACQLYWRNTRRFHMSSARGWADIGYSFAVCPHGVVMEGRGWQRAQAAQPGGNTTWTSVTFCSGDGEEPTTAQLNAFKELRAWLRSKGLGSAIKGHRDFISTSCPGGVLYQMVKSGALLGAPEQEDDMALSGDDVKKVWTTDGIIESPPDNAAAGNKYWTPGSYLVWGYRQGLATQNKVTELETKMTELADKLSAEMAEIKALLQPKES
ncbi:peptidoglycan recognition protein family protein [Spirillospora sp. CA-253888]